MKKSYYFYCIVSFIAVICCACVHDEHEKPDDQTQHPSLTVDDARAFFETNSMKIRTRSVSGILMPFEMGEIVLNWSAAEMSVSQCVASVDIPVEAEHHYQVMRENRHGEFYAVRAWSKIVVVKSPVTDSLAVYIRVCIPDASYAAIYAGDIAAMTLNCEDRVDYCGLEYYATPDGIPVAVSKYIDGKPISGVFLFDKTLSIEERVHRFTSICGNMWILRESADRQKTRSVPDDWPLGRPGDMFLGTDGTIYVYMDNNNDGVADTIVSLEIWMALYNITLYDGGGGTTAPIINNPGDQNGGGGSIGGYDPDGPNNPGGETGGGGNPNGKPGGDTNGNNNGYINIGGEITGPHPPVTVDPQPWQPWTPDILPPQDDDKPEEKKPCFDLAKVQADPLMDMHIFGTIKNGIKGGRYGTGRGKQHNGLDLDAAIGTPVYVMFSGKVTGVVSKYDPTLPYNRYKYVYTSDDARNYNAGNRIWIQSTTSKGTILIKFFHLNNISVNLNQQVSVGDVIGYSGATGSACSPESAGPHLHVEAYLNGKLVDPEEFLYTRFDENGNVISVDCY